VKKNKKEAVKRSLKYSILDGAFYSSMVGFGESFFSAFAVFLKASNLQLGLLGSLPQALGSLTQLWTNKMLELFKSRKRLIIFSVFLQALMYIPVMLVFFFGTFKVQYLILFVTLYWVFGMIPGPAWGSWMGDLVGEKERGSYFGKRNKIAGFVTFVAFMLAGYLLQIYSHNNRNEYIGFLIIFIIALISRIGSLIYLSLQYEPKYTLSNEAKFSFLDFVKQLQYRNYGRFVIFLCFVNFAVFISGPFFTPYLLYDLKFDYLTFTIVTAVALVVKFMTMPAWGKLSDRYGTKKILAISTFMIAFVPLFWVFSTNLTYLITLQVFSGFAWAGFEITTFNFIFDSTSPKKRATCIAYYNLLNGAVILIGAILGGLIVRYNHLFWSRYYLVFIASSLLRFIAAFAFVPLIKEVRKVKRISNKRLLIKVISIMPTMGMIHHIMPFKMAFIHFERKKN